MWGCRLVGHTTKKQNERGNPERAAAVFVSENPRDAHAEECVWSLARSDRTGSTARKHESTRQRRMWSDLQDSKVKMGGRKARRQVAERQLEVSAWRRGVRCRAFTQQTTRRALLARAEKSTCLAVDPESWLVSGNRRC
eukprot:1556336-Rhodomonas_salina.1